jgi:hypothetical protein
MTSNNDFCSLLSELKEYGLLNKYPDLERALKLGYQQLLANSKSHISANPVSHTAIYEAQARHLEAARQGHMSLLKDIAKEKPKPAIRQINDPAKMLDKEKLLEDWRQFR